MWWLGLLIVCGLMALALTARDDEERDPWAREWDDLAERDRERYPTMDDAS